ncbi:MAG: hypothetical protein K6F05_07340 [Succinivibrio sp.]|nr:hypothetical protein [Succinivibrio sp.]
MAQVKSALLRERLQEVGFTARKASLLGVYAFICTLTGLLCFGYLTQGRYQTVQEQVCAQVAGALESAARLNLASDSQVEILSVRHYELPVVRGLGRGRDALKTELVRLKGQRRRLSEGVYEFRFVREP